MTASTPHSNRRTVLTLVAALLLAAFVGLSWIQYKQFENLRQAAKLGEDNLVWSYAQLYVEFTRLRHALMRVHLQQGSAEALENLRLRYDIFISRIDLAEHQTDRHLLAEYKDFQSTINALKRFVADADRLLGPGVTLRYDAEGLAAMDRQLMALEAPVIALVQETNTAVIRFSDIRRTTISQQIMTTSSIAGFMFLLIVTFALIAYRQMRAAEKQRDSLEHLAVRLEEARHAAESASRSKSAFLANMSHEIRTPMHGVLGMLELIGRTELAPSQRDYVETARDSAQHLMVILNDILDISKLEAGRIELEMVDTDLHRLLGDLHRLFAAGAHDKQLELSVAAGRDLPRWVRIDPVRVRQILLNLISNAIKFTEQGAVTVSASPAKQHDSGPWLQIDITDTGIGMDDEALANLFQRFMQADASTTRRHGGTGLGLEISRSLALLMGGEILVQSKAGQGSTFTLLIPYAAVPKKAEPAASQSLPQASAARQLKILAVDDNVVNLKVISAMLKRQGHEITLATSGAEAVRQVSRIPYDLILMDGQMPEMSGIEATQLIRALPAPHGNTLIVALTADAMVESREQYLQAGMDAYLTKPVSIATLDALLAQLFSGDRAVS